MGTLVNPGLIRALVFLCYIIFSNLLVNYSAMAAVIHHKWEVENALWSPDGAGGVVIAINHKFPGPTLRARAGDTIHVELTNKLHTEGVVIHWHGIRQIGTPWADGTASISQCAINPGESFNYTFQVDKAGTYFYHGHYGMQRSGGLYGLLIVDVAEGETEKFKYDGEFDILLTDWWHNSTSRQEVDLSTNPMQWIGEPQSLLINGRGQFNCSLAAQYSNPPGNPCTIKGGEQYAPAILKVDPGKTYRLRIASSTSLAMLNLEIGSHKLVVVEADGNYVEQVTVDNIDIHSGESYSVLFTADQDRSKNYWISGSVRGRQPKTPQALTILNYLPNSASLLPDSPPPVAPRWDDDDYSKAFARKIVALAGSPTPPPKYDRRLMLLNTQNFIDGYTKWAINNVSLTLPTTPYLGAIWYDLVDAFDQTRPQDKYPADYDTTRPAANQNTTQSDMIYWLQYNSTIDVILQNANVIKAGVSEVHPWHLHGHDFWVLGYGEGKFVEGADEGKLNLQNPPLKNTVPIFPYGWTALRFVADNPGVWAFHCHLEPHLHLGMGVIFTEGVKRLPAIPHDALICGLTGKMFTNND